jgi:hypothetical protein
MYRMCGWCYADLADEDAVRVFSADTIYNDLWQCADEDACFARQDWMDECDGMPPRRHVSWLRVTARNLEGEPVL